MSADRKLTCGCWGTSYKSGWRIVASAFLCPSRHRQGDYVIEAGS